MEKEIIEHNELSEKMFSELLLCHKTEGTVWTWPQAVSVFLWKCWQPTMHCSSIPQALLQMVMQRVLVLLIHIAACILSVQLVTRWLQGYREAIWAYKCFKKTEMWQLSPNTNGSSRDFSINCVLRARGRVYFPLPNEEPKTDCKCLHSFCNS